MIRLTKLDDTKILVGCENIKYIESTPDTLILFVNGDSLIIRESLEEVQRRVIEFRRKVLNQAE